MARPPRGHTGLTILNAALDRLANEVEQASNYPFQDGKSYHARTGFHALFLVADALGTIDRAISNRIAAWLPTAPGIFTPQLIAIITRLSRVAECHDAALCLARHAEKQILLDTDISTRVSSYGALARAVWRVSTDESAAYFRRTLDLADAIGSDDFDRTNHLLEVTSHYTGPALSPSAGHTLSRILELNQNEDSKFPWIEYAQTMVPTAGLGTLAIVARLDDRDKAHLGLSLGPALTVLLHAGKLSGDVAACLFGLVAPVDTWTWQSSAFVKEALVSLPSKQREWLFCMILAEIDREYQLSPSRDAYMQLLELAESHLPTTSFSRVRIAALAARRAPEEPSALTRTPGPPPVAFEIDVTDPEAIDRAILDEEIDQSRRRLPQWIIGDLARTATPAKRLAFVRAVVNSNAASLAEKLRALDEYLPAWAALSPALKDALPRLALLLAGKHAAELAGPGFDAQAGWRGLDTNFAADHPALVERVVESLGGTAAEISGDSWLALAAKLAPFASAGALAEGLERFLNLTGATLPAEIGDGPWDPRFVVREDPVDVVAGLIRARLGHRSAAMRWRAAHAVLRLAEVERFDVINRLVAQYDSPTNMPFGDAGLPFYPLHAQLWLLIALARLATDRPAQIATYLSLFERVAFANDFPHVVMRAFAIDALRAIAPMLDPLIRGPLVAQLATANQSPFAHEIRTGLFEGRHLRRPDTEPRPDDAFHLDYDFNKYQVEAVCRAFSCAGWEVEDRVTRWVRRWDPRVRSMYDCPRSSRRHDDTWSSGSVPKVDRYGSYLAWHALMLAAGELLYSRVITEDEWRGDAWAHFIAEYRLSRSDGRWLSEATDLFPLDLLKADDIPMPEVMSKGSEREDRALLSPLLGIVDGAITGPWMPVAGHWSMPNDINVTLSTVLATPDDARATLMTVLTDELFFRWLPDDEDEIERNFGREGHSVREWINTVRYAERQFDGLDSYAATTAMRRPAPAAWVQDLLGVGPDDPIIRNWSDRHGCALRSEAWGAAGGRGDHSRDNSGARISVERSRLLRLLEMTNLMLVGSLKLQRYYERKSSPRPGDTGAFTNRSLVFTITKEGRVEAPLHPATFARKAVRALGDRDERGFRQRFAAISAAIRRHQD